MTQFSVEDKISCKDQAKMRASPGIFVLAPGWVRVEPADAWEVWSCRDKSVCVIAYKLLCLQFDHFYAPESYL